MENVKPLLVYDGNCPFCRQCARFFKYLTKEKVKLEPFQSAHKKFPKIPINHFESTVHLFFGEQKLSGMAAILKGLDLADRHFWWKCYQIKWMKYILDGLYNFVSVSRPFFSKVILFFRRKSKIDKK